MEQVYRFLKEKLPMDEKYIVVGVSGGVDSMVLLHVLLEYCSTIDCQIVCAHVHHNVRKESDQEQIFVKKYCQEHHVIFETKKLTYDKKFTEQEARMKRYDFFEEILKKYQSHYLLTAHHGDDLIETIWMKLVRGTTLKGAIGIQMESKRSFYNILRPLLSLSKEEIYQYAQEQNLPYVEDSSNQDSHYTRNRYRQEILPFLKQENENVEQHFLEYSQDLEKVLAYIEKETNLRYNEIVVDNKLNWRQFQLLDSVLQDEILKKFLFQIYQQDIVQLTKKHFHILQDFLRQGEIHRGIDLPVGKTFYKDYQFLYLKESQEYTNYQMVLEQKVILPNGKVIEVTSSLSDSSNFATYLDSSMLALPLIVRNSHAQDTMTIKNMKGHKKIGDIFTNEKVPFEERKEWPVVVDSNGEIIWLPGLKKTQFDRKKDGKYDIILKYY